MAIFIVAKRCGEHLQPLKTAICTLVPSSFWKVLLLLYGGISILYRLLIVINVVSYELLSVPQTALQLVTECTSK